MSEILLIHEVAQKLRVSPSTVNRWLSQARRGESTFPLPISAGGGKGRWTSQSIDRWVESQAIATVPVPVKRKSEKQKAKEFIARQQRTEKALDRFRTKGAQQ